MTFLCETHLLEWKWCLCRLSPHCVRCSSRCQLSTHVSHSRMISEYLPSTAPTLQRTLLFQTLYGVWGPTRAVDKSRYPRRPSFVPLLSSASNTFLYINNYILKGGARWTTDSKRIQQVELWMPIYHKFVYCTNNHFYTLCKYGGC